MKKGFTLMEAVLVIAILAILAALIAPLAVNQIQQARYNTCRDELNTLKQAFVGNPSLVEGGTRSSYGFVGDLGVLPVSLQELVTNPNGLPTWQAHASGFSWGWRGPYVSEFVDPWGRNYQMLTRAATTSDYTRVAIWSMGTDGVDQSADDIAGAGDGDFGDDSWIVRIYDDEISSTVSGNVLDPCGAQAPCDATTSSSIIINYPSGSAGVQQINITLNTGSSIFDTTLSPRIPIGIRSISATIRYLDSTGTVVGNVGRLIYLSNGPVTTVNLRPSGPCN